MKKLQLLLVIGLLTLFVAACGTSDKDEKNGAKEGTAEKAETITVEHELDTTEVTKNPEKVVVFDFGILDTMDKLGIKVAGVPQAGVIPSYLEKFASEDYGNVGSLKEPDFEKIAEINPDLIIISSRQSAVYDQLKELAPTIYLGVDPTKYMDSFKENMQVVADIFDKQSEIDNELKAIDQSIAGLQEKTKDMDEKALIVLANDDKISAYGPNSRFGLIHDVFGVPAEDDKIEASTHGMNVSFEYVLEKDPAILYVVDRGAAVGGESSAKQLVENTLVKQTNAYKNDRIKYLDPEFWYLSGGGLVSVKEMIKEVEESL
ncbi:siderophore ABC transporter substrate-binding protein [Virgibacillus sp. MG-45]|uniref:siderophore ABC transporter substrate-binding protein n=1 Tax=Virgibacillus sp. MG-45 TaxID=3102791 RepID=UPI002EDABF35